MCRDEFWLVDWLVVQCPDLSKYCWISIMAVDIYLVDDDG